MENLQPDYDKIPISALVSLAHLVLKRANIASIPVYGRKSAIAVIRGIKPAPPRKSKVHVKPVFALCGLCCKPLLTGELCDSLGRVHLSCQ